MIKLSYTKPLLLTYDPPWTPDPAILAANAIEMAEHHIRLANEAIKKLSHKARRANNLYGFYSLTAMHNDGCADPIIKEPERVLTPIRRDPSHTTRADLRDAARKNSMPVMMLWDRFPPITDEEHQEMRKDVDKYYNRSVSPRNAGRTTLNPFEKFLRTEALKTARRDNIPVDQLIKDHDFRERVSNIWKLLEEIGV